MGTKNNPGAFDCYANAEPDEPMFVLLGRDPLAPLLVMMWASMRLERADFEPTDAEAAKIREAFVCARNMWGHAKAAGKGEALERAAGQFAVMVGSDAQDVIDVIEGEGPRTLHDWLARETKR